MTVNIEMTQISSPDSDDEPILLGDEEDVQYMGVEIALLPSSVHTIDSVSASLATYYYPYRVVYTTPCEDSPALQTSEPHPQQSSSRHISVG